MTDTLIYVQTNKGYARLKSSVLGFVVENEKKSRFFDKYEAARSYFNELVKAL